MMYKVLLIIKDDTLVSKLRALHIWGETSGFEIADVRTQLFDKPDSYSRFELIVADQENGLRLLRQKTVKKQKPRIALCSSEKNFETARQGIVLDAYDYITEPFDITYVLAMLNRVESELSCKGVSDILAVEQLTDFFNTRDKGYYDYLDKVIAEIKTGSEDMSKAAKRLKSIYEQVLEAVLFQYQWCDLYISDKIYKLIESDVPAEIFENYSVKLKMLFSLFCELYPPHNPQLDEVITTILNYPEGDIRQKTLSVELHINNTYLSTVFLAQTGVRFVDYVNDVKLKRAAWLLLNTKLEIMEIAKRLGYKDKSYFSKLFRAKYGGVPSVFRMPPDYDFQI